MAIQRWKLITGRKLLLNTTRLLLSPKDRKRTTTQCKNHYNTTNALVTRFHGCWTKISNTYESGRSDEQLMEKVHAE
jgi:hypothetical protein